MSAKTKSNIHRNLAILALLILVGYVRAALATPTIYYIDFAGGSDSNSGTSKSTPWKHAPGMPGVSCSAGPGLIDCGTTHLGGSYPNYQFIFKGGVTWNIYTTWTIREYGTSCMSSIGCDGGPTANNVYFGVDKTWYTGSSWSRPIMNCGGSANCAAHPGMLQLAPRHAIVVDNFEWTGYYWSTSHADGSFGDCIVLPNDGGNVEFLNHYFHGWSHGSYVSGTNGDNGKVFCGDTQGVDATSSMHDNVADGSDTAKDSMAFAYGGPNYSSNYVTQVENGIITAYAVGIHDNFFDNIETTADFDTTQHHNCYENNGGHNELVYNNVCQHVGAGTLGFWLAPCVGYTSYNFNNILWGFAAQANIIDTGLSVGSCGEGYTTTSQGYGPGGNLVMFNDTVECGPDSGPDGICVGCDDGSSHSVTANFETSGTNSSGASSVTVENTGSDFKVPPGNALSFTIAGDSTRYYFANTSPTTATGSDGTTTIAITPNLTKNETAGSALTTGYSSQSCAFKNMHLITNNSTAINTIAATYPSQTLATNLAQTLSVANGQGYMSSETYVFSPISGGSTIGGGTNLLSTTCSTISSLDLLAGTACGQDTGYGVGYDTSTHTVIDPNRTPNTRASTWDEGAYQYQ
jgi:hypothetical protein